MRERIHVPSRKDGSDRKQTLQVIVETLNEYLKENPENVQNLVDRE